MTEQEWLNCADADAMLTFMKGKVSDRRLRLFGVACCRLSVSLRTDPGSLRRLQIIERYADGGASEAELELVFTEAVIEEDSHRPSGPWGPPLNSAEWWEQYVTSAAHLAVSYLAQRPTTAHSTHDLVSEAHGSLLSLSNGEELPYLRDIFGNTFRSVIADSTWFTSTVIALARQMYASRDFSAMPIIADALQDAGCESIDLLNHCRLPGPHVRGCWVIDALLGKE